MENLDRHRHDRAVAETGLSRSVSAPFWKSKSLKEMNEQEWESLCDGCGKCCLIGLEDEDTGEIFLTDVACKMLDAKTCRCRDYANRKTHVPDCVKLTPEVVSDVKWLPWTCAYRLIEEGKDLFPWHPLISGDPESVHRANVSVRDKVTSETRVKTRNLIRRIKNWPAPSGSD
jgi:hypothetical protein